MKSKLKVFVGVVLAAVMMITITVPAYAITDAGCGGMIIMKGTQPAGSGNCSSLGGVSGCTSPVFIDTYWCPSCSTNKGTIQRCSSGHITRITGQVSGYC